jgi:Tfp pilus assembly protein PilE
MSTEQHQDKKTIKVAALTLIETLVSLTILAVLFLIALQSFNTMLLGSYLIDARIAVRNEGEFVNEFFSQYAKSADPRSIVCNSTTVSWQPIGSAEYYHLVYEADPGRFVFKQVGTTEKISVLTYGDVIIKDVKISCEQTTDTLTGQIIASISVQFKMDSTVKIGDRPAVLNVQRYITVVAR